MDCLAGDITSNDPSVGGAAPHAWDEGWAFYAGSLEGEVVQDEASTEGVMVYKLANKRCENFGTCKDGATGVAKANLKHLALARNGRDKILAGECHTVAEEFDAIVDQMTIPLIQGMLKYSYKSDPAAGSDCASVGDSCDKALGEGWAFAAAVLPRLNYCDSDVAKLVKDNLDVTAIAGASTQGNSQMTDTHAKLKTEVEKTYPCLGITCAEVGVYKSSGLTACSDASATSATVDLEAEGLKADTDTIGGGFTQIAGYIPSSNVVPHSKIDEDMDEINDLVGSGSFSDALFVYENGGNGKCTQAQIDAATGFGAPASSGACQGKTTADPVGNSLKSSSIRTLKGFATSTSMAAEKWYNVYKNYWKSTGMTADKAAKYADTNVRDAFEGTGAFATTTTDMKAEVAKKGVAFQAIWMYVLHEYEDAIMDCLAGDITSNDATVGGNAPHAWDEGWAFYAGSLEGTATGDKDSGGKLLYNLANKRCADFGTCTAAGVAKANLKHLALARNGRDKILAGECHTVVEEFDAIVDQMTIPLIQGMLKYAYLSDPAAGEKCAAAGAGCNKALGEGWAFAAAVLPRLNYCDSDVAKLVKDNLDVTAIAGASTQGNSQMTDTHAKLKTEVEKTYPCLGITCEEVGAYKSATGVTACSDASTTASTLDLVAEGEKADVDTIGGAVAAAFAMVLLNVYT